MSEKSKGCLLLFDLMVCLIIGNNPVKMKSDRINRGQQVDD